MVALREKHNGSNDDDAVELLHDVRLQPNAIPEVVSMVLQSIELASKRVLGLDNPEREGTVA